MKKTNPLVSIGVPLYNEEEFLDQALHSLLAQDYPNLEIILSDNASTDSTPQILAKWASKDKRIRIHLNPTNIGATQNFSQVADLASGEFFMWGSGHDLWAPDFVSSCLKELVSNPKVCLAFPQFMWIDNAGNAMYLDPAQGDTRGWPLLARFIKSVWRLPQNSLYGISRRSALNKTRKERPTIGPDQVLLVELGLLGDFAQIQRPLFFRRQNRPPETFDNAEKRRTADIWAEKSKTAPKRLYWKMVAEMIAGTAHVLSGWRKVIIVPLATIFIPLRFIRLLLRDLVGPRI